MGALLYAVSIGMSLDNLTDRELLVRINEKLDGVVNKQADHEARIRSLEQKVWFASGICSAIAFVLGKVWK